MLAQGVDQSAPKGAKGYRGFVTALDVHLNADHGGLPAGTEILVGYAEAAAMTRAAGARDDDEHHDHHDRGCDHDDRRADGHDPDTRPGGPTLPSEPARAQAASARRRRS